MNSCTRPGWPAQIGEHADTEGVGLADERGCAPGLAENAVEQAHLLGEDAAPLVAVVDAPSHPQGVPRSQLLGGGLERLREHRDLDGALRVLQRDEGHTVAALGRRLLERHHVTEETDARSRRP